jgi:hypothetical protein
MSTSASFPYCNFTFQFWFWCPDACKCLNWILYHWILYQCCNAMLLCMVSILPEPKTQVCTWCLYGFSLIREEYISYFAEPLSRFIWFSISMVDIRLKECMCAADSLIRCSPDAFSTEWFFVSHVCTWCLFSLTVRSVFSLLAFQFDRSCC